MQLRHAADLVAILIHSTGVHNDHCLIGLVPCGLRAALLSGPLPSALRADGGDGVADRTLDGGRPVRVHQRDAAAAADKVTYLVGLHAAGRGDAQWWLTAEQTSAWRAVGIVSQQTLAGSRPLRSGQSAVQSIKS